MPRRQLTACAEPGCPTLTRGTYCEVHQPKAFASSTRRARVGKSGWEQQRDAARILRKYRGVCHVCGLAGADEVDHVIPTFEDGADDDSNKRPIHSEPCHRLKTAAEAARARRASTR